MKNKNELNYKNLKISCDPSIFKFKTTEELDNIETGIGQERGIKALEFGLNVDINGYKQLKEYFGDRVIGIFIESSEPGRRARAIASRADFNIDEWNRRFKDDIKKFPQNLINKYFKLKFKNKDIENSKDLLKAISKKFDEGEI